MWVVLLEAASEGHVDPVASDDVSTLLAALNGGSLGVSLSSSSRYALQVTTTALDPADALAGVLSKWSDAVRALGLPTWPVVRTEVLTPEELQRDIDNNTNAMPLAHMAPLASESGDDPGHELLRQAFSDPLTGLITREVFQHRLQAVLTSTQTQGPAAVLCLDLDRFATSNERFDSAAGDRILLAVAHRLERELRTGDVLARTGPDEYAVLIEEAAPDATAAVAERLLEAVRRPLSLEGDEVSISASAGSAFGQPGDTAQAVLGNAAAALAAARKAGGNRYVAFG